MAGIATGLTSRPTYDAADALLKNKQIEYERELRLKQMALQAKLARQQQAMQALGMLNQNLQQRAAQANQQQMQERAIAAQMQRDAQQQQAQAQSLLERQFNEMQARWQQGIDAAKQAGMGFDPRHQPEMSRLEDKMLETDQLLAAGAIDPATAFRRKMAILQQLAAFKPDMPIEDPVAKALGKLIRVGPDGQRLAPGDPPVPGERQFTIDGKGDLHAVTPLPQPKTVDPAIAEQKLRDAMSKEEMGIAKEKMRLISDLMKEKEFRGEGEVSLYPTYEAAEKEAMKRLAPLGRAFESQFGVPSKELTPPQQKIVPPSPQAISAAQSFLQQNPGPSYEAPDLARMASEARSVLSQAEAAGSMQPESPPMNINGQALSGFPAFALSADGQSLDESNFSQHPISGPYTAAAGGDPQQAYQQFDADRAAIEQQVPKISSPEEMSQLPTGSMFFNDRGDLLQNIPNPQPKPPRRGSAPRGGGGGGVPRLRVPAGSPGQKPGPPGRGVQKLPQQRGVPLDRMLGSGDGKDRRGNVPPQTRVILKKGDPNNQKILEKVIGQLTPEELKQLSVAEVDPSQPEGPNNRTDLLRQHDIRHFPTFIRQEWDGKKYVDAARLIFPQSTEELSAFMKNGEKPPPPNGNMAHTYVILDAADKSDAAAKWAKIASEMTPEERANVTVFKIDSRLPDSPTNDFGPMIRLGIDPQEGKTTVVRGEWNGERFVARDTQQGEEALKILKDTGSYRDWRRPDSDREAERQLEDDVRNRENFTRDFGERMDKHGDPVKGVQDPYRTPEAGDSLSRLRQDAIYRDAYENWRNSVEGADPNATEMRPPPEQVGPTAEEIEAQKQKIQRAISEGKLPGAKAPANVPSPQAPVGPVVPPRLQNISRTTGLSPEDEQVLQRTQARIKQAESDIARLNIAKAERAKGGKSGERTKAESEEYDAAKAQVRYSEKKASELLEKGRNQLRELQQLEKQGAKPGLPPAASLPSPFPKWNRFRVPSGPDDSLGKMDVVVRPTAPTYDTSRPYDSNAALRDVRAIGQRMKSGTPADQQIADQIHQRLQTWARNTLSKGNTKIGGYDLIGEPKASANDAEIARDILQAAGLPKGTGVLQGLKQINEGRMNPVSVDAARMRLQQRIEKLPKSSDQSQGSQDALNKAVQQAAQAAQKAAAQGNKSAQQQQQERDRMEQRRLTTPQGTPQPGMLPQQPSSMRPQQSPAQRPTPTLPPVQPSRTRQLTQGISTNVMKPGALNLDQINASLSAMGGANPQPYTGGIIGGTLKPPTQPSGQLGGPIPQPLSIPGLGYSPPGGFIQQPGYSPYQDFGAGSAYGSPYDYGYNVSYPDFGGYESYLSTGFGYGGGDYSGGGFAEPASGYEIGGAGWDLGGDSTYDAYFPTYEIGPAY